MISSASSMRLTCSPTAGQSIPQGVSLSDSPEPIPRKARPGNSASSVMNACAVTAGWWRCTGAVTGANRDPLGRLSGRPEHHPGVPRLSRFPPRLEMVAQVEPVEAGALGLDGLSDDVGGRELLGGELGPVARLGHGDSCFDVPSACLRRAAAQTRGRPYVAARRCGL